MYHRHKNRTQTILYLFTYEANPILTAYFKVLPVKIVATLDFARIVQSCEM